MSFEYMISVELTEPLNKEDFREMRETIERSLSGDQICWQPEDFEGDIVSVKAKGPYESVAVPTANPFV
jgi:C-terminal processing protease CtpA/Prc